MRTIHLPRVFTYLIPISVAGDGRPFTVGLLLCIVLQGCASNPPAAQRPVHEPRTVISALNTRTTQLEARVPDNSQRLQAIGISVGQLTNTCKSLLVSLRRDQAEAKRLEIEVGKLQGSLSFTRNSTRNYSLQLGSLLTRIDANRSELAKIEAALTLIRNDIAQLPDYHQNFVDLSKQISVSTDQTLTAIQNLASTSPTPKPTPDASRTDHSRGFDALAAAILFGIYACVMAILVLFLAACLIWGIWKIALSIHHEFRREFPGGGRPTNRDGFRRRYLALAVLCSASAILICGMAFAADPGSAVNAPGAELPAEIQKELTTAIWQAPLAILAIVLAIGGLLGYQAYQDTKSKLERELSNEIREMVQLAIGVSLGDAAFNSYSLAMALTGLDERVIDAILPPDFGINVRAHVGFAKEAADAALQYIGNISRDAKPTFFGRSKEYHAWQAGQSYAYYVATRYSESTEQEWDRALAYSDSANDALEDPKRLRSEPGILFGERAHAWKDTFFYVRVLYAMKFMDPQPDSRTPVKGRALRRRCKLSESTTRV
jgi:hypothetical protein